MDFADIKIKASKKEKSSLPRGKPNSSIITNFDELKRAVRTSSLNKPSGMKRSSLTSYRNGGRGAPQGNPQDVSKSKFLNAFKKKTNKIDSVVKKIQVDSKLAKLRMLELDRKNNWVDYGDGYREVMPDDYENESCWLTDPSEDEAPIQKGLLPLRSEVDYKRRQ